MDGRSVLIVQNSHGTSCSDIQTHRMEYKLPQVTYSSTTVPTKASNRYHWLGYHYVWIIPQDFRKDSSRGLRSQDLPTDLFKVMTNRGEIGLFI